MDIKSKNLKDKIRSNTVTKLRPVLNQFQQLRIDISNDFRKADKDEKTKAIL